MKILLLLRFLTVPQMANAQVESSANAAALAAMTYISHSLRSNSASFVLDTTGMTHGVGDFHAKAAQALGVAMGNPRSCGPTVLCAVTGGRGVIALTSAAQTGDSAVVRITTWTEYARNPSGVASGGYVARLRLVDGKWVITSVRATAQ